MNINHKRFPAAKKEEIWLSPITESLTPTEIYIKQRDNTKTIIKKNNTNRGILQLKNINPLPRKRKLKICHLSNPRYKLTYRHLMRVIHTQLHTRGFVAPMLGTIVYRTVSKCNSLFTKYSLLSISSTKIVFINKGVVFLDSNFNILTVHINVN